MNKKTCAFVAAVISLTLFHTGPLFAARTMNILVYPFSASGAPGHEWISAGMTDSVISDLNRIKGINVFSDDDRKKAVRELELSMTGLIREQDIPKVGHVMGANLIFTGSYTVSGDRIRVIAKLMRVGSSAVEKSIKLDDTMDNIFGLQDRVVTGLMSATKDLDLTGYTEPDYRKTEWSKGRPTPHPGITAYELYSRGLQISEQNPKGALEYINKALVKNPSYVEALIQAAWVHGLLGEQRKALQYYSKAKTILTRKRLHNSYLFAQVLANTGIIQWNLHQYHNALRDYERAMTLMKRTGKTETGTFASTLTNTGSAYRSLGDHDRAMTFTLAGKKKWESMGLKFSSGYAWTLSNLGVLHYSRADYEKALACYRTANQIWEQIGLTISPGYATTTSQIGYMYNSKGDYDNALKYLEKGTGISEKTGTGNTETHAWYLWYISSIYNDHRKDPCKAASCMGKAVKIFRTVNHRELPRAERFYGTISSACRTRTMKINTVAK
ncbi:MAG TPA: tetratricopeptide repeat protein [Spirochaetota bacterium]|mgnify:CR=1 FL=1|nr:tetratricopeptide repeat protein [Spirochaetota bacterium]HQO03153.1 tetratricopeptide repeat protein [Spirochaetota bacterium]HQP48275.1 tetratricopeptide repeat protein [Spirochaetota bacterium]